MKEIWKDIPGYEGYYQASNLGRIKSLSKKHYLKNKTFYLTKEKILKQTKNSRGYLRVTLNKKQYFVHRLVAITFISNDNTEKNIINHKDCNPLNNCIENLEWCTNQENVDYMISLNRNKRTKVWLNNLHKSQEKSYKKVKGTNKNGDVIFLNNINEAKKYDLSPGTICACCKKYPYFKSYHGYVWEYVE